MNASSHRSLIVAALLGLLSLPALAQEEESEKPKTHTVKTGPFEVEVTLDGVFESTETYEIVLRPEVWSSLKVEEVVPEGTRVKKGDTLLKLETDKLDESIRDQEFALKLSELALAQAEVSLKSLEKSVPLDLEAARRSQRIAEEEMKYFLEVTEAQRKESAKESLKSAEYSLEYAQEELDQLEQMYKADDLTEQTEEIILKRAQRSVERSQYFLDLAKDRYERSMKYTIPREKQQVEESYVRSEIDLVKAEATLPKSLDKQRIDFEKTKLEHARLEEKLQQHQADRALMVVKAPAAGLVYYGQADRGQWTTAATVRKQLRPFGTVSANSVLMSIVAGDPTLVRVDVPEKDYRYFKPGAAAAIKPKAFPRTTYEGKCGELGPVAVKSGTFDGEVRFTVTDGDPVPVAGMTGDVTITAYQKDDAVTVPSSAVFGKGDETHVFLEDGGEARKQVVRTGETSGDKTEILDGLSEGDVILLEKP